MFTIFKIGLLRLWNNKQELVLALVVPMLFFSIFALIFGHGIGTGTAAIKVALIDDDFSATTNEMTHLLEEQEALQIDLSVLRTNAQWPLDKLVRTVMRDNSVDVVVYLPRGLEQALQNRSEVVVSLFSEGTNPVGRQIVKSMLSQVVAVTAGELASRQRVAGYPPPPSASTTTPIAPAATGPLERVSFEDTDVFASDKHNPKIAMYAAGIAVMFLLFSATGAGGSLLEEYEAGTLDRLLTTRLSLTGLLFGKWLYILCLGCVQLTVMFMWAQIAFGVDLLGHLPGFAVMAGCTAAATASLAICLAVFCRSRAELNGVSIVLILTMSALGGSMVPRYIMSEQMQRWGQLTFNAWALDGFKKVFWYDLPVASLQAEIKVLLVMTIALACFARIFADRWAAN